MKDLIANATGRGNSGTTVASNSGRTTPYIPPSVAGDGNAQHVGGEARSANPAPDTANSASPSRQLRGSGATIQAGVLTFTLDDSASPDNGKSMSYKVMRPAVAIVNPNAPKPTGNSGVWMGEDPKNSENVVQFYVQDNCTVAGTVMSGIVAQAMKRMMMATPQRQ
jgi:hypothetical protein